VAEVRCGPAIRPITPKAEVEVALDTGRIAFQHLQKLYLTVLIGYHRWSEDRSRKSSVD